MNYLAPDYLYTPSGLQRDQVLAITDDGFIASIVPRTADRAVDPLPGVALLPGFVNTHSHVFQRALRGHTHRPLSAQDTFWSWRRAMYAQAARLDPDLLYASACQAYREMLAVGYTTVGEFHYVHHQPGGTPYANPNAMAEALLAAGRETGLRVVLLLSAYAQGGFDQPPEEQQRRFCDASIAAYLERVETLRAAGVPVGVAPHSVRAVPGDWLSAIAQYSRQHALPLHIHADEQLAELEQTQAARGCTPIALLERYAALHERTTVIHATHASADEIALLARHACTVCVCPTTEGDLGDGIAPYAQLLAAGVPLAIGADSNTRLDPFEELRWAEYSARMRYRRRRVLVAAELAAPGPFLLTMGTAAGARALGLASGELAAGQPADLVAIGLTHPMLAGWTSDDLLDMLCFGASAEVIVGTWVQGRQLSRGAVQG
ncbi:MAG TPA: formimidoylglutamate deiminase [Ktedonobacteraceae bacterium]|jgi:formimidoylglutamate deiminase